MLNRDVEQLSLREHCHSKKGAKSNTDEMDSRIQDTGNDSASTAPRSTEESLSEDVFTESELSPIREELVSSDELRQDKSSGASSESVQTINQTSAECLTVISDSNEAASDLKPSVETVANVKQFDTRSLGLERAEMSRKGGKELGENIADVLPQSLQRSHSTKEHDKETEVGNSQDSSLGKEPQGESKTGEECQHCEDTTDSQKKETTNKEKVAREQTQDSETEVEELRKLWKTHTMQQTKQQRENMQQGSQKQTSQKTGTAGDGQLEGESVSMDTLLTFRFAMCPPLTHNNFIGFHSVEYIFLHIAYISHWFEDMLRYVTLYKPVGKNIAQETENVDTFFTVIFPH